MNKTKALMKRASWLAYCLEIGWDKSQLPALQKTWDEYYDENGNKKPQSPSPNIKVEEENEVRRFIKFVFMEAQKGGGYTQETEDYFLSQFRLYNTTPKVKDVEEAAEAYANSCVDIKDKDRWQACYCDFKEGWRQSQQPVEGYAEAVEFAEYINDIGFKKYAEGWCQAGGSNGWHCTGHELYKKFKEDREEWQSQQSSPKK